MCKEPFEASQKVHRWEPSQSTQSRFHTFGEGHTSHTSCLPKYGLWNTSITRHFQQLRCPEEILTSYFRQSSVEDPQLQIKHEWPQIPRDSQRKNIWSLVNFEWRLRPLDVNDVWTNHCPAWVQIAAHMTCFLFHILLLTGKISLRKSQLYQNILLQEGKLAEHPAMKIFSPVHVCNSTKHVLGLTSHTVKQRNLALLCKVT